MEANSYEVEKGLEKLKKGTLRGHLALVSPFPGHPVGHGKSVRAAKSSVDFWKEKVRGRTLKDGSVTPELYARMKEGGRDAWFNLATANRAEAARKARDLWQEVQVKGLAAVLEERRPDIRPTRSATVGELLIQAKAIATVRASTLAQYEISLRRLVAGVLGLKHTPSVYGHKSPANLEWRARVEGASLDVLTDAKVEGWRKSYIAAAADEVARISRKNTASATIRNARAFFAPSVAKAVGEKIRLPSPLPLVGLSIGSSTRRFKSAVDARKLYGEALKELRGDELTAFLLCIVAGLRRGEADMLPWAHVELDAALVLVAPTKWFLPKTEESQRTTPLPPDVVAHLRACRVKSPKTEFVLSGADPAKARDPKKYRCDCWTALITWLKGKGFLTPNPIHELRKLSGSLVNATAGLEAARRHLGHRNISTTAASYVTGSAATINLADFPQ